MWLLKLLCNVLKRLFKSASKHSDLIAKGAVSAGGIAALAGISAGVRAKRVNKQALIIQNEAISKHEESLKKTEDVIGRLGDLQIEIIKTFDEFANLMESIQKRPSGIMKALSKVSLPDYNPQSLKILTNNLQMVLSGAGGTAAGLGIGVAAFGVNTLALGPGAVVGGFVLCVKGMSLSKKATKNMQEAQQIKKDVDRIIEYHSRLQSAANELYNAMEKTRPQYLGHLSALRSLVAQKTVWKEFSMQERKMVQNTIMLVTLMHEMCSVRLVQRTKEDPDNETVNEESVKQVRESVDTVLPRIDKVPVPMLI